ncbi:MAG: nitrous oxide reductase family maturation protein NosD [Rubricoccaceae bacterium]|nr:nitrous oxide reductase family maturation protein NosD [Rubricoccaceae bacterium]
MRFFVVLMLLLALPGTPWAQATHTAAPDGPSLTEVLRRAAPGDRIVVRAGVYREPTLVVDKPVVLDGEPGAVLDGEGERVILRLAADRVTVRGLTFRDTGVTFVEDRAALHVEEVGGCTITGNRFEDTFFGIYLADVDGCTVTDNVLVGAGERESRSGNGIHLWYSTGVTVARNEVRRHRDGIYFEFVEDSVVEGNLSEANRRYGLHFMFSDRCRYLANTFRANGAGVAVMYSEHVAMNRNTFADNWGPAAFGLLLKEIDDAEIVGNRFLRNTVGLFAESTDRVRIADNDFVSNGWAIRVLASASGNRFTGNNFVGNSFDVGTNSRRSSSTFSGNYWDGYRGYDLDRDGTGDVPFRPVRLFALIVENHEPALLLLRSLFVDLLDLAERVAPSLTPDTFADAQPAMRLIPR